MQIFKGKLKNLSDNFKQGLSSIFSKSNVDEILDELEEFLVLSDVSIDIVEDIMRKIKKRMKKGERAIDVLREEIIEILSIKSENWFDKDDKFIALIVGVNGGGKTTSIAKLGALLKKKGKSVIFAAADTFRAAGGIQLEQWGNKLNIPVVSGEKGADPSSVVYNALNSYKKNNYDVLIIDTAGRVHTKENLMNELKKITKVIKREFPDEPKEVLLVLDATIGQNAIVQAREFRKFSDLTGIILTKMDGTAKGGTIISIAREFSLPVKFICTGESVEDIQSFSPQDYAKLLFE